MRATLRERTSDFAVDERLGSANLGSVGLALQVVAPDSKWPSAGSFGSEPALTVPWVPPEGLSLAAELGVEGLVAAISGSPSSAWELARAFAGAGDCLVTLLPLEDTTRELRLRVCYGALVLTDAVAALPGAGDLADTAVELRRAALSAARREVSDGPDPLRFAIDGQLLSAARLAGSLRLPLEASPDNDLLLELATDDDAAIASAARLALAEMRDTRWRTAMAEAPDVAEALRGEVLAAGWPDPRGAIREYEPLPWVPAYPSVGPGGPMAPDVARTPSPTLSAVPLPHGLATPMPSGPITTMPPMR